MHPISRHDNEHAMGECSVPFRLIERPTPVFQLKFERANLPEWKLEEPVAKNPTPVFKLLDKLRLGQRLEPVVECPRGNSTSGEKIGFPSGSLRFQKSEDAAAGWLRQ
jgi:hypothetical protein